MAKRKHLSEFGLNMQAQRIAICRLSELEYLTEQNYFTEDFPCHIYFIGTRPKITIDKDGFKFDKESFTIRLKAQIEDKFQFFELDLENPTKSDQLRLDTKFPYFSFKILDGATTLLHTNGPRIIHSFKDERFSDFFKNVDFNVLYIGQSYGIDGARTAPDRLKSHSTMQAILEDVNKNNPDKDVILALFSFKQWLLMSFDGTMELSEDERQLDNEHLENVTQNVLESGLNEKQEINFTEAALIRYFRPTYNEKFKDTFPSLSHSSYEECYAIDINSIMIELLTSHLGCQFYSDEVDSKWEHYVDFNLHTYEDRKGMFEF